MKEIFQRLKSGGLGAAGTAQGRLTLGVFGKHPGWDDHILGLGAETGTVAHVKQALYVDGIGGQIDSGAWERLDSEKRLPGYDHVFLWLTPGHTVLGLLWSSTDGKGRSKYPMALVIDSEGLSPAFVLNQVLPGLERLRDACKNAGSAEQVTRVCAAAQEQLRALMATGETKSNETPIPEEERRRFFERAELGPNRLGLLRVLHELGSAGGVRARHVRVPLANESRHQGLVLWTDFLQRAIPQASAISLFSRQGTDWLDAIVGEPVTDDLFCLQASVKAVPLATQIPYDLRPETEEKLRALDPSRNHREETRLDAASRRVETDPPEAPRAALASPPPAAPAPVPAAPRAPARTRSFPLLLAVLAAVMLVGAALVLWLSRSQHRQTRSDSSPPPLTLSNHITPPADIQRIFLVLLKEGQDAFQRNDFSNALAKADHALNLKPGDDAAGRLKMQAEEALKKAVAATMYQSALVEATNAWQAAETALKQQQWEVALTAMDAASNQCARAVTFGDPDPPNRLLALLEARRNLVQASAAEMRSRLQKYTEALRESTNALSRAEAAARQGQYDGALAALDAALKSCDQAAGIQAGDEIQNLRAALVARRQAWRQEQITQAEAKELARAQAAFDLGDYAAALERCGAHPGARKFDDLKTNIISEQDALKAGGMKLAQGDYSAVDRIQAESYSRKPPFSDLLVKAAAEKQVLAELTALKQASNAADLKRRLAEPAVAGFTGKPPFQLLRDWAESAPTTTASASVPVATQPDTPAPVRAKLETHFEVLSVWFNMLSPKKATTPEARAERPLAGELGPDQVEKYLAQVRQLKEQFDKGGWLTPARQKELNNLETTIRNHP